jgi:tetratricopeptide (TPR) repeat protein
LDEAEGLARGLKNDSLLTSVFDSRGDVSFDQGDLKSAKQQYEQAQRQAAHTSDKDVLFVTRLNAARVAVADGRARGEVNELRSLSQQADAQGRKYVALASSVLFAEAMIKNKDYSAARQELQRDLGKAEKQGLRLEDARVHYLLGTDLRLSGNTPEAAAQYREARRLLDEITKEQGAEHATERYDLKSMYAEATQYSQ